MNATQQSQLLLWHAQGKLNRELTQLLGVSEATVKRWKKSLGLGSNCPMNNQGQRGVQLFIQELQARGLRATDVSTHSHCFDVLVGGKLRVEVKTARPSRSSWRFRLPATRPSFHGEGKPTLKNYVQDCDLLALVALDQREQLAFVHLRQPVAGETNVVLSQRESVDLGRDNWALLDALLLREAA